jgi:hypothetical protein
MYENIALKALTTRQNMTTDVVSVTLGLPRRPTVELLFELRSAGLITSQVTLNLSDAKSEHRAQTRWTITPMGRARLSAAIRQGAI